MALVGIDLGTTFSVIATPQLREGEFFEQVGGVTIIRDEYHMNLIPSVVGVGKQGDLRVGYRARARIGQKPEPIVCVKRAMGQNTTFLLGKERLRPEEVSSLILAHLKKIAEDALGEPVEQAVITVPAYFTLPQKQLTKEAGEKAGLNVSMILQEPVAAALTYCQNDVKDPLTIMTYDLGGGTFDVAIIRKRGRVFSILSVAGDRQLGGHDFDQRLAQWLLEQINQQGDFSLPAQPDHPRYPGIMAQLTLVAEEIKKYLSEQQSCHILQEDTRIFDLNDKEVALDLKVERATFESLIKDYIDATIRQCWVALNEAQPAVRPTDLDTIVMVGGSSRIPLLSQRLEAEFGCKPRLFEPDLAVAIGATLQARLLERRAGAFRLGYIPEVTSASTIEIDGALSNSQLQDGQIEIALPDGKTVKPIMGANGFIFVGLPLMLNVDNVFILRALDQHGTEIERYPFTVRQSAEGERELTVSSGAILAKPISVLTASNQRIVIAEKRMPLPNRRLFEAKTADQSGQVVVVLYEEHAELGRIVIEDVSSTLQRGTLVQVELEFTTDFFINGRAYIPLIDREKRVTFERKLTTIGAREFLYEEYQHLSEKAADAFSQAEKGQVYKLGGSIRASLETARHELEDEPVPNLARCQEHLDNVRSWLNELTAKWQPIPPADLFQQQCGAIESELLPALKNDCPQHYDPAWPEHLNTIRGMGMRALTGEDQHNWEEANRQLADLHDRLLIIQQKCTQPQRPSSSKEERDLRTSLGIHLTQLHDVLQQQGRLAEFEEELNECRDALQAIDMTQPGAQEKVSEYYRTQHEPLVTRIQRPFKPHSSHNANTPQATMPQLSQGIIDEVKRK